jgi:hypothetical protein
MICSGWEIRLVGQRTDPWHEELERFPHHFPHFITPNYLHSLCLILLPLGFLSFQSAAMTYDYVFLIVLLCFALTQAKQKNKIMLIGGILTFWFLLPILDKRWQSDGHVNMDYLRLTVDCWRRFSRSRPASRLPPQPALRR